MSVPTCYYLLCGRFSRSHHVPQFHLLPSLLSDAATPSNFPGSLTIPGQGMKSEQQSAVNTNTLPACSCELCNFASPHRALAYGEAHGGAEGPDVSGVRGAVSVSRGCLDPRLLQLLRPPLPSHSRLSRPGTLQLCTGQPAGMLRLLQTDMSVQISERIVDPNGRTTLALVFGTKTGRRRRPGRGH